MDYGLKEVALTKGLSNLNIPIDGVGCGKEQGPASQPQDRSGSLALHVDKITHQDRKSN